MRQARRRRDRTLGRIPAARGEVREIKAADRCLDGARSIPAWDYTPVLMVMCLSTV